MIRDFDQIHVVTAMVNYSGGVPADAAIVGEVVAEGDAAVGPLLVALESDARETRCFLSRNRLHHLGPVSEAVSAALKRLLKTERLMDDSSDHTQLQTAAGRQRLAAAARVYWEKNREVSLAERWYRTLRDDSAGTPRWLEAAAGLIQPVGSGASTDLMYITLDRPPRPAPGQPMNGDALRDRRDPSVSDLMARRAAEIAGTGPAKTIPDVNLLQASNLGLLFSSWDERASLPTIKRLMATNIARSQEKQQQNEGSGYYRYVGSFATVRARAGDLGALDEYAAWVKTIKPRWVTFDWGIVLEPFWRHADHPAIAAAARALFLEPKSPWLPMVNRTLNTGQFPELTRRYRDSPRFFAWDRKGLQQDAPAAIIFL